MILMKIFTLKKEDFFFLVLYEIKSNYSKNPYTFIVYAEVFLTKKLNFQIEGTILIKKLI